MKRQVNIALQILPRGEKKNAYSLVEKAIEIIQRSGVKYKICPFETVMEGDYDKLMEVVKEAQEACFSAGAEDLMVYVKIQRNRDNDVTIDDKMKKYE